jgi:IS30 family transposase
VPARVAEAEVETLSQLYIRGRMGGTRSISQRPRRCAERSRIGHREGDPVIGAFDRHCILTLVDRKSAT